MKWLATERSVEPIGLLASVRVLILRALGRWRWWSLTQHAGTGGCRLHSRRSYRHRSQSRYVVKCGTLKTHVPVSFSYLTKFCATHLSQTINMLLEARTA